MSTITTVYYISTSLSNPNAGNNSVLWFRGPSLRTDQGNTWCCMSGTCTAVWEREYVIGFVIVFFFSYILYW